MSDETKEAEKPKEKKKSEVSEHFVQSIREH